MATWPSAVATNAILYVAVNSLQTTLSGSINNSVTTITLASTTGFPTAGAVTIGSEVIFYTGISGAQLTGCTRGSDGTTAASHNSGVPVGATVVACHHNLNKDEIIAIEQNLSDRIGTGSTVLLAVDGAVGAPAFSFASHPTMGIYQTSGNMSLVTNGIDRFIIGSTLSCLLPLSQQGGTAGQPQYTWSNDLDTGLWHSALDEVAVTCGGTTRFTFSTAAHTSTLPILVPAGSTSNCAVSTAADTNTGLVWNSADNVSLISGGGGFAGGEVNVTSSGVSINSNAQYALGINGGLNNDYICQIANNSVGVSAVSVMSATTGRATALLAAFSRNYSDSRCGHPAADMANIEFGGSNLSSAAIVTQTAAPLYIGTNQTEAIGIDTSQVVSFVHGSIYSDLTASTVPYLNSSKKLTSSSVTPTELGYVSGVTSAIQTQMNLKAPLASPTFTGTVTHPTPFTLGAVSVTATGTEMNYLVGVTSAIQTQLNLKAPLASPTFSGTITTPLTASRALTTGASSELAVSAVTSTELGYVSGVTSAIQTQLGTKAPTASPTFTGVVAMASGGASAPSLTWGDVGTGFYKLGTNFIGASAGATAIWSWYSGGIVPVADNAVVCGGAGNAWSTVAAYNFRVYNSGTGSGNASLGTGNCPAVTATAPFVWLKMTGPDGSTVYIPAWK